MRNLYTIVMIRHLLKKSRHIPRLGSDLAKTAIVSTAGRLTSPGKSPDEAYAELFNDVQVMKVYGDGKTFVDMIPRARARELRRKYDAARKDSHFNMREFVDKYFYELDLPKGKPHVPTGKTSARHHVARLWTDLKRRNRKNRGSLFALPHEYVVPGGRFSEQFYWDTYFIMLGLAADKHWDLIVGMVKNYAYMISKFGFIPTANRTYFLSRSQPPFFAKMVQLVANSRGKLRTYAEYLPVMLIEYRFWMKGRRLLRANADNRAYARVVEMPNGTILNRYYDDKSTPRPESRLEDLEAANLSHTHDKERLYLDLRAGAESGWDFSSRWFRDPHKIQSIHTTDLVPVDLNCLMYELENTIADSYGILKQSILANKFRMAAIARAEAISHYCWDEKEQFFCDYDFRVGLSAGRVTLAGVFPLYAKIATEEQAAAVAERLKRDFLQPGGLLTTLVHNGQQWDAPNGWAPLQWVAIQGLREYGYGELANQIRDNWLHACEAVFATERKMVEKYDVTAPGRLGGGGEYSVQDGFGWTNGVYAALKDEQMAEEKRND